MAVGSAANGAVITSYTPRSNDNYVKGVGSKAKTAMQGLLTSVSASEGPKDSPRRHHKTDKGHSLNSKSFNENRKSKSPNKLHNSELQEMPKVPTGYVALP